MSNKNNTHKKKTKSISIRVREDQYKNISDKAKKTDLTVSEYLCELAETDILPRLLKKKRAIETPMKLMEVSNQIHLYMNNHNTDPCLKEMIEQLFHVEEELWQS